MNQFNVESARFSENSYGQLRMPPHVLYSQGQPPRTGVWDPSTSFYFADTSQSYVYGGGATGQGNAYCSLQDENRAELSNSSPYSDDTSSDEVAFCRTPKRQRLEAQSESSEAIVQSVNQEQPLTAVDVNVRADVKGRKEKRSQYAIERRRAQNRISQRVYRERKEGQMRYISTQLDLALKREEQLRNELIATQKENRRLLAAAQAQGLRLGPDSAPEQLQPQPQRSPALQLADQDNGWRWQQQQQVKEEKKAEDMPPAATEQHLSSPPSPPLPPMSAPLPSGPGLFPVPSMVYSLSDTTPARPVLSSSGQPPQFPDPVQPPPAHLELPHSFLPGPQPSSLPVAMQPMPTASYGPPPCMGPCCTAEPPAAYDSSRLSSSAYSSASLATAHSPISGPILNSPTELSPYPVASPAPDAALQWPAAAYGSPNPMLRQAMAAAANEAFDWLSSPAYARDGAALSSLS